MKHSSKKKSNIWIAVCVIFSLFCSLLFFSGCEETKKSTELTETDLAYIDTVYQKIDNWDKKVKDSSETFSIDKIAFYDIDGTNRMCFYVHYPITDIYGKGFFIDTNGNMNVMKFDLSSNDNTINQGWIVRTRATGMNWDSDAYPAAKLQTLKEAYIYFKENNIYKK